MISVHHLLEIDPDMLQSVASKAGKAITGNTGDLGVNPLTGMARKSVSQLNADTERIKNMQMPAKPVANIAKVASKPLFNPKLQDMKANLSNVDQSINQVKNPTSAIAPLAQPTNINPVNNVQTTNVPKLQGVVTSPIGKPITTPNVQNKIAQTNPNAVAIV